MWGRGFIIGFLMSPLIFLVANLYSYYRMRREPVLIDTTVSFGLPFRIHMSGGFVGDSILWPGLLINILIAICLGIILGLVSRRLLRKQTGLS
jgi:hypothetical protein